jgi:hypothetical protein
MNRLKIAFAKNSFFILLAFFSVQGFAQTNPEGIFKSNVHTVRFHSSHRGLPIYNVNSGDQLQLDFDDLDNDVKSYYYTYQLCDYNWQPVDISTMDYIKGFTQVRISDYQFSSIAYTKYTHYTASLPDQSSVPTRSGNYLLKVFLDGDTTNLVFTRRFFVVDAKTKVSAQVVPTISLQDNRQRVQFTVGVGGLNAFSAGQQVKVMVLQNYRWDNAQGIDVEPTYVRNNVLEYNTDNNFAFPAGNEWRWVDIRSLSLRTGLIDSFASNKTSTDVYMRPEGDRSSHKYVYYTDQDGLYNISTIESNITPAWQNDYATVHFKFAPPNHQPFPDQDVYIIGQLTDYQFNDNTKMVFNQAKGVYEASVFLKEGYYDYDYLLVNKKDPTQSSLMDGDHFETENNYTVFVYYRSFNDQSDQLVGIATINSLTDQKGVSF